MCEEVIEPSRILRISIRWGWGGGGREVGMSQLPEEDGSTV